LESEPATVTITVTHVNHVPEAVDDTAVTDGTGAVNIPVLKNDRDVDGDKLTIVRITQGGTGSVVVNADGTVTYTPGMQFVNSDSFTYTISDGQGGVAEAVVRITRKKQAGGK